jgi:hypothetical protein
MASGADPGCGIVEVTLVWPVILRHRGRGHGRSPDHRPLGGYSSPHGWGETHKNDKTASSMELGWRSGTLPDSRSNGRRWLPCLRHSIGDKILVGGPPYTAWRRTGAPPARTLRTATPRVRRVGSKQGTPSVGQPRQFTTRDRQQRSVISAARQRIEHVKPVPYRLSKDLTQNPVHLSAFPAAIGISATRGLDSQPHTTHTPATNTRSDPALRRSAVP